MVMLKKNKQSFRRSGQDDSNGPFEVECGQNSSTTWARALCRFRRRLLDIQKIHLLYRKVNISSGIEKSSIAGCTSQGRSAEMSHYSCEGDDFQTRQLAIRRSVLHNPIRTFADTRYDVTEITFRASLSQSPRHHLNDVRQSYG